MASIVVPGGNFTCSTVRPTTFEVRWSPWATASMASAAPRLNELEFAGGSIYANVWQTDRIARIDPASGRVTGWLDLAGLLGPGATGAGVLNGIAWDPGTGRLWVTGKLWPRIFVIEVGQPVPGS